MSLIAWIKQVFAAQGKPEIGSQTQPEPAAAAASEYIAITKGGGTHTFLAGTTAYTKGHEPAGGHSPATTIEYED